MNLKYFPLILRESAKIKRENQEKTGTLRKWGGGGASRMSVNIGQFKTCIGSFTLFIRKENKSFFVLQMLKKHYTNCIQTDNMDRMKQKETYQGPWTCNACQICTVIVHFHQLKYDSMASSAIKVNSLIH